MCRLSSIRNTFLLSWDEWTVRWLLFLINCNFPLSVYGIFVFYTSSCSWCDFNSTPTFLFFNPVVLWCSRVSAICVPLLQMYDSLWSYLFLIITPFHCVLPSSLLWTWAVTRTTPSSLKVVNAPFFHYDCISFGYLSIPFICINLFIYLWYK